MGYLAAFFAGMVVGVTLLIIWAVIYGEDRDG